MVEVVVRKKSKLGPSLLTLAAAGLLFRTFYRPARAVIARGYATKCPGPSPCSPALIIDASAGTSPIYAVTSGKAVVTAEGISIVSDREPIVVSYGPSPAQVFVQTGNDVGLGQELGLMSRVRFTVTEIVRDQKGVSFRSLEPASFLAARGLRIAMKDAEPSALWCSHGRTLTVPKETLGCGLRLAPPSSMMLLPVSVTTD